MLVILVSSGDAGEGDAKDIMDIYKEQKRRDALENELTNKGIGSVGNSSTLEQMKQMKRIY
jgi:hypothetical protein